MIRIIDLKDPSKEAPSVPCGLVLGNFDGVHRGHLALIERLKSLNKNRTEPLRLGAFCFENHPFTYLGRPLSLLCNNEEKMALLKEAGLDFVIFGDFMSLKDMSPEDFVRDFLSKRCDCRLAVCGFNYSFGAKGAGKAEDLKRLLEAEDGRAVSIVPPVTDGDQPISSTIIREMLSSGKTEDASRLLGRTLDRMSAVNNE